MKGHACCQTRKVRERQVRKYVIFMIVYGVETNVPHDCRSNVIYIYIYYSRDFSPELDDKFVEK